MKEIQEVLGLCDVYDIANFNHMARLAKQSYNEDLEMAIQSEMENFSTNRGIITYIIMNVCVTVC